VPVTEAEYHRLARAIERGDLPGLRELLERGTNPNAVDPDLGSSIVELGVRMADAHALSLLRQYGADIDFADRSGSTALSQAVSASDANESVVALLAAGANPNTPDRRGWTPLHHAAVYGFRRNVAALVRSGADRSLVTNEGQTAEDLATTAGHHDIYSP
jgi:uncharacterized protein